MVDPEGRQKVQEAASAALRLVSATLPHLTGLAHLVQVEADTRVGSAGIFPSGRLLVNPTWFLDLDLREASFVLAHELLHLAMRTHQRASEHDDGRFNTAHDYIINDMLEHELLMPPPGGGLRMPGARFRSAEQLIAQGEVQPLGAFLDVEDSAMGTALRDALRRKSGSPPDAPHESLSALGSDALSSKLEREWFPDEGPRDLEAATQRVERAAAQAVALEQVQERAREAAQDTAMLAARRVSPPDWSSDPSTAYVDALRTMYRPPWEIALHRWMEAVAPDQRTYARPSRRGADRTDVVLPGRTRVGWTLSVVLDTSGSMSGELSRVLGVIGSFCQAVGVEAVRIVQCDTAVTRDEVVDAGQLERYEITGFGGSDMSPALWHLASDPEVEAAVVLTDGGIDYPSTPMPYAVLWVLTEGEAGFTPSYGQVIQLPPLPRATGA